MNQPIAYDALEKNICDTLKEWELKIGCSREPVELYYPRESLRSLLQLPEGEKGLLQQALENFTARVQERLGAVEISRNKDRFCIRIPENGSRYVQEHIKASPFLVRFLEVIHQPGSRIPQVEQVFYEFSHQVEKRREAEGEYIFFFHDSRIDEYVYCVEEDEFGLEYHRFTRADYQALFEG